MWKVWFGLIAFAIVASVFVGIGVLIGGGWAADQAGHDHTAIVTACIDKNGGSMTKPQFEACVEKAEEPAA